MKNFLLRLIDKIICRRYKKHYTYIGKYDGMSEPRVELYKDKKSFLDDLNDKNRGSKRE